MCEKKKKNESLYCCGCLLLVFALLLARATAGFCRSLAMVYQEMSQFFCDLGYGKKSPPKINSLLQETPNFKLSLHKKTPSRNIDFHPLALSTHPHSHRAPYTQNSCPPWEAPPSSHRLGRSLRVCCLAAVAAPLVRLLWVSATAVGVCCEPSYVWSS